MQFMCVMQNIRLFKPYFQFLAVRKTYYSEFHHFNYKLAHLDLFSGIAIVHMVGYSEHIICEKASYLLKILNVLEALRRKLNG